MSPVQYPESTKRTLPLRTYGNMSPMNKSASEDKRETAKQSPRFDLEAGENDRVMQLEIKIVWIFRSCCRQKIFGKEEESNLKFFIGVTPFYYFCNSSLKKADV